MIAVSQRQNHSIAVAIVDRLKPSLRPSEETVKFDSRSEDVRKCLVLVRPARRRSRIVSLSLGWWNVKGRTGSVQVPVAAVHQKQHGMSLA